jgi:hypothetical protein
MKLIRTGLLLGLYAYGMKCFLYYFLELDIIRNIFSLESFIFTMHLPFVRNGINYLFDNYFDKLKDSKNTHLFYMPLEGPDKEIENNIKVVSLSNQKDNLSGDSSTDVSSSIEAKIAKMNELMEANKQLEKEVKELIKGNLNEELGAKFKEFSEAASAEFSRRNQISTDMRKFCTKAE